MPSTFTLRTAVLRGLDAIDTTITVAYEPKSRTPGFRISGLSDAAARETKLRVQLSFNATDLAPYFQEHDSVNVTVSPTPPPGADGLDLPIAVAVLVAMGKLPDDGYARTLIVGALGMDGSIRPVRGVLPLLRAGVILGFDAAIVPAANRGEALLLYGIDVRVASSLEDISEAALGTPLIQLLARLTEPTPDQTPSIDFSTIRGQQAAKRALEVAAAGGHNLLMVGPPGAGKTLLARAIVGILPALSTNEMLQTTCLHSVAGIVPPSGAVTSPPFRAPHHTVSEIAMAGGGPHGRPGEVSLAHNGVLFLDELAEFRQASLTPIREAKSFGSVTASVASSSRGRVRFPASILLVAAANPCPCGYAGHPTRQCQCTDTQRERYERRVAELIPAVIDARVSVSPVQLSELGGFANEESSATVRARVTQARIDQRERQGKLNAQLSATEIMGVVNLGSKAIADFDCQLSASGLGARRWAVLRLARTIADLADSDLVRPEHLAEAISLVSP